MQILHGGSDRTTYFDDLWLLELDKLSWIPVKKNQAEVKRSEADHEIKGKAKEKGKEKETEKETGKEVTENVTSQAAPSTTTRYWPSPRRDHVAFIHQMRFFVLGGKDSRFYAWDYLSGFDCGRCTHIV